MMRIDGRTIGYVLFDLDETLYPKERGLMSAVGARINDYMQTCLGIPASQVLKLREKYYRRYGTTSRGLYLHHHLDVDDYLSYVHDLPVQEYLAPDPQLDEVLGWIEAEKAIFTNAPREYATRVLEALGVERYFNHIFDVHFLEYINKPDIRTYRRVLEALRAEGRECVLVDDLVRNLKPSRDLGMVTVLVGDEESRGKGSVDFVIPRVTDLRRIMEKT